MSLATRCTACSTVFRVVQEQLNISEGWVRCGRCNEVFNALQGLFDLDRDTPSDWTPPAISVSPSSIPGQFDSHSEPLDIDIAETSETDPYLADTIDSQRSRSQLGELHSAREAESSEHDRIESPPEESGAGFLHDEAQRQHSLVGPLWAAHELEQPLASPAAPEFVRRAQRQARWQSPLVRAALLGVALALAATLVLQGAHHFRDVIAARWPQTKPALLAWCSLASCAIEAPRRIEDVSVESSALTRASSPDVFKLSVSLRNRGALTVALPSVDLSLTDAGGQLVARRVVTPRDFRAASTVIAPGAESPLQLELTAGALVTGYTVEIFYP